MRRLSFRKSISNLCKNVSHLLCQLTPTVHCRFFHRLPHAFWTVVAGAGVWQRPRAWYTDFLCHTVFHETIVDEGRETITSTQRVEGLHDGNMSPVIVLDDVDYCFTNFLQRRHSAHKSVKPILVGHLDIVIWHVIMTVITVTTILKSSYCNSYEDTAHVDLIHRLNLQMSCRELTTGQCIRIVTSALATRQKASLKPLSLICTLSKHNGMNIGDDKYHTLFLFNLIFKRNCIGAANDAIYVWKCHDIDKQEI